MSDRSRSPDSLTVLVFKDNLVSRSFRVPMAWISKFGILLGIIAALILVSGFAAVKFYRLAKKASPERVQDLELENADLRAALASAKTLTTAQPSASPIESPSAAPIASS